MIRHEKLMRVCLQLAKKAAALGEVPVGALIVRQTDGQVLGQGYNGVEQFQNVTKHAEMVAIESASAKLGSWRLNSEGPVTMYTTVEPCIMCLGASILSRVDQIVYGAPNKKFGGSKHIFKQNNEHAKTLNHHIDIVPGVLEGECAQLMRMFFQERRSP